MLDGWRWYRVQPGAGRNVSVFVFDEPFLFLLFFLFFFLSFWSSTLVSVHITRYAEYLQFSSLSKRYVKGKHASVSGFFFLFFFTGGESIVRRGCLAICGCLFRVHRGRLHRGDSFDSRYLQSFANRSIVLSKCLFLDRNLENYFWF